MQYELNLEVQHNAIEKLAKQVKQLEQLVAHLTEKLNRAEANAAHSRLDASGLNAAIDNAIEKLSVPLRSA